MPELPEVETLRAGLEEIFGKNTRIEKVKLNRKNLRVPIPHGFAKKIN